WSRVLATARAISSCWARTRYPASRLASGPDSANKASTSLAVSVWRDCESAVSAEFSGMNIGYQQHLQSDDLVLDLQLALFQAPNGELVGVTVARKAFKHRIEISVLFLVKDDTVADRF